MVEEKTDPSKLSTELITHTVAHAAERGGGERRERRKRGSKEGTCYNLYH